MARKVWEKLEQRMNDMADEFAGIRSRLGEIRERCPHKVRTKLDKGFRCPECGDITNAR